jgi:hypothetical protein
MKVLLLMSVLLVGAAAPPVIGNDRLRIAVTPAFSHAPSSLRVRVKVDPHPDNRLLQIVADSEHFSRSSDIQLDGDESPITFQREMRDVPGGVYDVKAVLVDRSGKERASVHATATVIGPGMTPPDPTDPTVP